eukprot:6241440-Prymnesium_polylepis.1
MLHRPPKLLFGGAHRDEFVVLVHLDGRQPRCVEVDRIARPDGVVHFPAMMSARPHNGTVQVALLKTPLEA